MLVNFALFESSLPCVQGFILVHLFTPEQSPLCSSSFAKSYARFTCSVVNALATVRCRYQPFSGSAYGAWHFLFSRQGDEFHRFRIPPVRGEKGCSLQHVHCYEERNLALFYEQIRFRDYLCAHPEAAEEYASLKTALCRMYANDRRKYTEGKQAFFDKIKRLAAAPHGGAEGSDSSSYGEAEPSTRRPNMLL